MKNLKKCKTFRTYRTRKKRKKIENQKILKIKENGKQAWAELFQAQN